MRGAWNFESPPPAGAPVLLPTRAAPAPRQFEFDEERARRRQSVMPNAPPWFVLVTLLAVLGIVLVATNIRHDHGRPRHDPGGSHDDPHAGAPVQRADTDADKTLRCPPGRHAYVPPRSTRAPVCALNAPFPDGVDPSILDNATSPCQDYMRYACGAWLDSSEPVDRAFREVGERNREVLDEIVLVESEREWGNGALGTYVRACVGATPEAVEPALRQFHDEIDAVVTPRDVAHMLGRLARYGFETPLYVAVESHPLDGTRHLLLLMEHVDLALDRESMSDAERAVLESFEQALAGGARAMRGEEATRNMADYARHELARDLHTPAAVGAWLPLDALATGLGGAAWADAVMAQPDLWVVSESYVRVLGELVASKDAESWRAYMRLAAEQPAGWGAKPQPGGEALRPRPRPESAPVAGVAGLTLVTDVITRDDEAALLAAVNAAPWSHALKRRTQHYGFEYNYATRTLPTRLGDLPAWSATLVDRLVVVGAFQDDARPNQLIVNEYTPGQGIAPHTDAAVFGAPIVSVSLGSDTVMEFSRPFRKDVPVVLPRRSAAVLAGEARTHWRHAIAARRADVVRGVRRERGTRVSLTFRIVPT